LISIINHFFRKARVKLSRILAYNTDFSSSDYSNFRKEKFKKLFRSISGLIDTVDKMILDIGCGRGESAAILKQNGANRVFAVDVNRFKLAEVCDRENSVYYTAADAAGKLPIKETVEFDLTVSLDSLEHEKNPEKYLETMVRHTRSGGHILIEFSHFNSIIGHHLIRMTRLPVHLLPRKWMEAIIKHNLKMRFGKNYKAEFRKTMQWYHCLNGLTYHSMKQIVRKLQVSIIAEYFVFHMPGPVFLKFKPCRMLLTLQAFLTFNTLFILKKD